MNTDWIFGIEEPLAIDDQEILRELEEMEDRHSRETIVVVLLCCGIIATVSLLWWLT